MFKQAENGLWTKTCSKCKDAKTLDSFSKNRAAKDGLQAWCKDCGKAYRSSKKTRQEIEVTSNGDVFEDLMRPLTLVHMMPDTSALWKVLDNELSDDQMEAIPGMLLAFLEDRVEDGFFLLSSVTSTETDVALVYRELFIALIAMRDSDNHEYTKNRLREMAIEQFM